MQGLKQKIENLTGPLSDAQFKATLAIATVDIKFNRVGFLQRTTLDDAIKIAAQSAGTLKRCGL